VTVKNPSFAERSAILHNSRRTARLTRLKIGKVLRKVAAINLALSTAMSVFSELGPPQPNPGVNKNGNRKYYFPTICAAPGEVFYYKGGVSADVA